MRLGKRIPVDGGCVEERDAAFERAFDRGAPSIGRSADHQSGRRTAAKPNLGDLEPGAPQRAILHAAGLPERDGEPSRVSVEEVAPGIYVTRAFEADEAADVVATAARATTWQDAGINADLQVDRSVRNAEVLFESSGPVESAAHALMGRCRDDFTGGETVFTDPATTIPIVTGTVVAFSPVLLHRAQPIIAGTKYVITAWYHTLPPRLPS